MLIATHTIVSGVVGDYIGNPFLAFLTGIFLHLILDYIPHYDTTDKGKFTLRQISFIIADFLLALVIILIIKPDLSFNSSFLWGAIGGNLIDIIDNNPLIQKTVRSNKLGKSLDKLHVSLQRKKIGPLPGILIQYFITAVFIVISYLK